MTTVDIVVPASRGGEALRQCLESIGASTAGTAHELIVIDDSGGDAELARLLRELSERRRMTVVAQPTPQGYAAALNRAFALHPDRDVVVVQSDAEVAGDWLARLARHASADVGVVATYTNAVGVATYPLPRVDNPLPEGCDVAALDALFSRANAGVAVALPAVHGPCLWFRRACIAKVGALDGAPLGSDYGVEIDFCLRAQSAGFRHLVAGDVFVGHAGHGSYGAPRAEELRRRTAHALAKLYPGYPDQLAQQVARDPARAGARRVDLLRLAELPRQVLVFVSHPWGGGIRRYMNDLAALVADRAEVLYLEPAVDDQVKLWWPRQGECFAAYFRLPGELPQLAETLKTIGVARLHFHHVHKLPRAILDLPAAVGLPVDCTLHDYFPICPQYHLVTESGRYCGEPDAAGCAACLARRPAQWGLDITAWRAAFATLLKGADRLIAPSQDVATRLRRYHPELAIEVWPHPEPTAAARPRVARVVVLGNLSPEKGLNVVAACADDAKRRRLPLTFRVIGSTTEPIPQSPAAPLSIHGQYDDHELPQLLAAERPDVILFAAQVPETYAYTLTVAIAAGLPIVASALGALPERLAGLPNASLVPWDADAATWNQALLVAAGLAERVLPATATASQRVLAS